MVELNKEIRVALFFVKSTLEGVKHGVTIRIDNLFTEIRYFFSQIHKKWYSPSQFKHEQKNEFKRFRKICL